MILRILVCALILGLATPALAADPLSYDDPGMHFAAPTGWERVNLGDAASQDDAPAALFAYHRGQQDVRTIVITIKPYDGSLADFANDRQRDLRQGSDNTTVFINKHQPVTLANGMPAFVVVSTVSSDARPQIKNYEYLVIDGQRSIDVVYTAMTGDADEKAATAALSTLYVVAFPVRRR